MRTRMRGRGTILGRTIVFILRTRGARKGRARRK